MAGLENTNMTTHEFLNVFVSPTSHKVEHNASEFERIKNNNNVQMVKATTFYQIYKHNVFGVDGDRLNLKEFYRACSQYFYYSKYYCRHGVEFYYYIIFNEEHKMYEATKDIIEKRVQANSPERLKDLEYIVEAMAKEKETV